MEKYPLKGSKSIALNQLVGSGGSGGSSGGANVGNALDGGTSYQSVTRKVCVRKISDRKIKVYAAAADAPSHTKK